MPFFRPKSRQVAEPKSSARVGMLAANPRFSVAGESTFPATFFDGGVSRAWLSPLFRVGGNSTFSFDAWFETVFQRRQLNVFGRRLVRNRFSTATFSPPNLKNEFKAPLKLVASFGATLFSSAATRRFWSTFNLSAFFRVGTSRLLRRRFSTTARQRFSTAIFGGGKSAFSGDIFRRRQIGVFRR